jgi:hypothetical protein
MKTVRWVLLSCAAFFVVSTRLSAAADKVFVLPIKDSVAVYQHEIRHLVERPLFMATQEDRLLVIESGKGHYLVKNRDGREGWIEKSLCARAQQGKQINFDPIDISSLATPIGPVYIGGSPTQIDDMIPITRSFNVELRSNVDRDEMEKKAR